jgi:hypothetical protein
MFGNAWLIATVVDARGRGVVLTSERWRHVTAGHPEFAAHQGAVLDAVRSPTRTIPGRGPDEEWCYLRGAGPSSWLKVVVAYEGTAGRIVTAFPRRSMP